MENPTLCFRFSRAARTRWGARHWIVMVLVLMGGWSMAMLARGSGSGRQVVDECPASKRWNRTQLVGAVMPGTANTIRALAPCTMQTCFDHLRCRPSLPPSRLKVYVYPQRGWSGKNGYHHQHLLEFLAREPSLEVVQQPGDACLLVPPFDTTCAENDCNAADIERKLQQLPHWNSGRNHVLLSVTNFTLPMFDTGEAILMRPSGTALTHRLSFDVQIPLYNNDLLRLHDRPAVDKDLLVTFQGRVYSNCASDINGPFASVRREMIRHLNDRDNGSLLDYSCHGNFKTVDYPGVKCDEGGESTTPTKDFVDNLMRSRFVMCPSGLGPHSYRFSEALSAGAIPILIGDELLRPFPDEISPERWAQCVLHVPETELPSLVSVLANISDTQVEGMQRHCRTLYHKYFISDDEILRTAFRQISKRLWFSGATPAAAKVDVLVLHTGWEQVSLADYLDAFHRLGLEAKLFSRDSFMLNTLPPDYNGLTPAAPLTEFRWRGYNLWSIARYQIAIRTRMTYPMLLAQLAADPKAHGGIISEEMENAAKYVEAAERLIALHSPSAVFLTQGCDPPAGAWRQVAIAKDLRTIVTENTLHKDRLTWDGTSGCSVLSGQQLSMFFRHRELLPEATVRQHTHDYFATVRDTKQGDHTTRGSPYRPPTSGKVVVFLGQVFTDCSVLGGLHAGFDSPADVVATLLQFAAHEPDGAGLVIKLHPKECGVHEHVANLTKGHMQTHPSGDLLAAAEKRGNVLLDACKEFDTYEVIRSADVVVTISSQAGLEAAAMGKPVILAGRSFYTGGGFTHEAKCPEELLFHLRNVLAPRGAAAAADSLPAETFLYTYLWKAGIPRSGQAIADLYYK